MGSLVCLTLASCALLSSPPQREPGGKALLDQVPAALPQQPRPGATVLVLAPETAAAYDTTRMAYTTQPHQVSYYTQREWGETPSAMLHPLLVRTLENTHSFAAVLIPPYTGRYSYALRVQVLELNQDFTAPPPALVLSMRLRLTDATGQIVATREVSLREPMEQGNSAAGVVAANNAIAKALHETATFVLENTG